LLTSRDVAANRLLSHHHHGLPPLLLHLLLHLPALLHHLHSATGSAATASRTPHSAAAAHPHSTATTTTSAPSLRVYCVGCHQTEGGSDSNRCEKHPFFSGKTVDRRTCESIHRKSFPGWWFSSHCRQ
jgi:hypothetical protein